MGDARWLPAVGMLALLMIVPMILCVGLAEDDDDSPVRGRPAQSWQDPRARDEVPEEPPVADEAWGGSAPTNTSPPTGERTFVGTVSDFGGSPVEGAEVMREGGSRYDETNEEGRYRLKSVPAAEVVVVARAPGYREERLVVAEGWEGAEERVDFTLEAGPQPAGKVIDPEGRAVRGATVACESPAGARAESDASGRFELKEAAVGCSATASHDSFGASEPVVLEAGPDNRLTLAALGSIAGQVLDAGGAPVRTFIVEIESFEDPQGRPQPTHYRQTFSHPQGRFTISRRQPGTYVLSLGRRGGEVQTKPLVLKSGEPPPDVRVVLP